MERAVDALARTVIENRPKPELIKKVPPGGSYLESNLENEELLYRMAEENYFAKIY